MKRFEKNVRLSKRGKEDMRSLRVSAIATLVIVGGTIIFIILRSI